MADASRMLRYLARFRKRDGSGWREEPLQLSGSELPAMSDLEKTDEPLVEAGRYPRLSQARLRALVVAAGQWPHRIERQGREWVLLVGAPSHAAALRELAAFEAEEMERPKPSLSSSDEKFSTVSLYVAAWTLIALFMVQKFGPPLWEAAGVAESRAILGGQWWRAITALTLHADPPHLIANLATGLLFAAFLIPRLGTGLAWLAIVISGALGNAVNAWGYRGESHGSIGASTACFGALGILVGVELTARLRDAHGRSLWQLVLPLGAGLALLAYLGVGDEGKNIDYMAHCWGFLVGGLMGIFAEACQLKERTPAAAQPLAAILAVALVAVAWLLALR
jgi:rhomboid protease GluP